MANSSARIRIVAAEAPVFGGFGGLGGFGDRTVCFIRDTSRASRLRRPGRGSAALGKVDGAHGDDG